MRSLTFVAALAALIAAAPPAPAMAQGRADSAALQAALALGGLYEGPIDGDWGPASAAAASGSDTGRLLGDLSAEWRRAGWKPMRGPAEGPGVLAPMGLLRKGAAKEGVEYVSGKGDLSLGFIRRDGTGTMALHHWLERSIAGPLTRRDEPGRLVSEGRLPDGTRVHIWSHFRSELDARTVVVRWRAPEARRARLLLASISPAAATVPALPKGVALSRARPTGPLDASLVPPPRPVRFASLAPAPAPGTAEEEEPIAIAAIRPAPRAETPDDEASAEAEAATDVEEELTEAAVAPPGAEMPLPEPGTVIGTGTGFFVGPERIVTNAHVVAPCRSMTTASGMPVALLAVDSGRDLALMQSKDPAPAWMPLGADEGPLLGAPVRVLGYPFGGAYHDGVSVTSGLVSARGASWVGAERLMISAPIQPGNSGGPVLSTEGEVIGVVTSRLNSADGTSFAELPQNMAYAVPTAALRDFLQDAGAEAAPAEPLAIEQGVPRDAEAAVVHLLCLS